MWNEHGEPVRETKGELVCTAPFVTMPLFFWNDPDGAKYRSAYFERFSGVVGEIAAEGRLRTGDARTAV